MKLMRPLIVKTAGFVLLYGGTVFETGLPNPNIVAINISSFAWLRLDAELDAKPKLLMLDIQMDYFKPASETF